MDRLLARQWRVGGGLESGNELGHETLLELCAGSIAEALDGLRERQSLAVGPRRRHGAEGIGNGQDSTDDRDRLSLESLEVALAVPPLVVMEDSCAHQLE